MTKKAFRNRPNFARVPLEVVARGRRMLAAGTSAAQVMRVLHVSYPTVLKWKKSSEQISEALGEKREAANSNTKGEPTRRTEVDSDFLLKALTSVLLKECSMEMHRDRDYFIAELSDHHNGKVVVQNRSAALAMADVLGKWQRTTERGKAA